jgi:hypothetical protein
MFVLKKYGIRIKYFTRKTAYLCTIKKIVFICFKKIISFTIGNFVVLYPNSEQ